MRVVALLEVDGTQLGAALEVLVRAGIPARARDDSTAPASAASTPPEPNSMARWSSAAPVGSWTSMLAGGPAQSLGQTSRGRTIWLWPVAGDGVSWATSAARVLLEAGPCPVELIQRLTEGEAARVRALAEEE